MSLEFNLKKAALSASVFILFIFFAQQWLREGYLPAEGNRPQPLALTSAPPPLAEPPPVLANVVDTGRVVAGVNREFEQAREVDEWNKRQGLVGDANAREEYQQFDLDALKSIADNGDHNAIYALGERLLDSQGSQAAYEYLFDMAAKGYINIYPLLASALEAEYNNADTPELKHEKALEVLVIYKQADLRGLKLQSHIDANNFIQKDAIELSQDDLQKIAGLSQALQEKWQARQSELGLGGFEPVPAVVISVQESALAKLHLKSAF